MTSIVEALSYGPTVSFEVFPARHADDGAAFDATVEQLGVLRPDFVAVTYGAGGTRRDNTVLTVEHLCENFDWPVVTHLTCIGHSRDEVYELIDRYQEAGTTAILALAGDPNPSLPPGDFRYAIELVEVIKARTDMEVGVAAFPETHPRSVSTREDRRRLKDKLDAADFGITQFFYDERDYWRMVDDLLALGCRKPVVPGVMPAFNPAKVRKFAAMNGSKIPEVLFRLVEQSEAARTESGRVGIACAMAGEQIVRLLNHGSPGVHLYTVNRADVVELIIDWIWGHVSRRAGSDPDLEAAVHSAALPA